MTLVASDRDALQTKSENKLNAVEAFENVASG